MNTEELKRLVSEATQGVLSTEGDGTTIIVEPGDETRFPIAHTYRPRDAALIVAAVNALPELLAMSDQYETLKIAYTLIAKELAAARTARKDTQ